VGERGFGGGVMAVELTREMIERAFDAMGRLAAERGLVVEIAVYGGSRLILASDIRGTSGDVGAVLLKDGRIVRQLADEVARRQGLPLDWINEAVTRIAPPIGNPSPNLLPFGEYPRTCNMQVGLRVFLPTPAYILAMKILANRLVDDVDKIQLDLQDAVSLMRITGISTRAALAALMTECYPNLPGLAGPALNPRINAKLDALMDAYAQSTDAPDPTWHAGRGPATRAP
jgi:hypothetical protein